MRPVRQITTSGCPHTQLTVTQRHGRVRYRCQARGCRYRRRLAATRTRAA